MKIILCLTLGLVLLSSSAWMWGSKTSAPRQQTAADIQRVKNEELVREHHRKYIQDAKEEGKNEVILSAMITVPTPQRALEELWLFGNCRKSPNMLWSWSVVEVVAG